MKSINSDRDILNLSGFDLVGTGHRCEPRFGMAMAGVLLARWDRC